MKSSMRVSVVVAICAGILSAQNPGAAGPSPLLGAFLLGEWTANTDTELGHATALTSFTAELDRHIVTRRSSTTYTSGKDAGTRHDDLLILYPDEPGSAPRAIYFDSEGHVIRYAVTFPAPNTVVFESDPSQPGPRYRLTHKVTGPRMETKFEIKAPGQSEFQTYVSGVSTRK